MTLPTYQLGQFSVVEMPRDIVYGNVELLKIELNNTLDNLQTDLVLDLTKVGFIDSSGLGVLVAAFKRAEKVKRRLLLMSPNDNIMMLLELTQLHHIFTIYKDVAALVNTRDLV